MGTVCGRVQVRRLIIFRPDTFWSGQMCFARPEAARSAEILLQNSLRADIFAGHQLFRRDGRKIISRRTCIVLEHTYPTFRNVRLACGISY